MDDYCKLLDYCCKALECIELCEECFEDKQPNKSEVYMISNESGITGNQFLRTDDNDTASFTPNMSTIASFNNDSDVITIQPWKLLMSESEGTLTHTYKSVRLKNLSIILKIYKNIK